MALHIRGGAHIPEHGECEGDNGQEAKRKDPNDVQNVRDPEADGAGNTATHTRPPRSIDLVAGSTCRQEPHKQDHAAQSAHRGPDYDEDHLQGLDPQESQVEHPIQHNDDQATASVHGPAEDHHSDEAHDGSDQGRVWNASDT